MLASHPAPPTLRETLGNWQLGLNRISKPKQLRSAFYVWWLCPTVICLPCARIKWNASHDCLKTFRLEVITPSNFKLFAATVVLQNQGRQCHNFFWLRILAACSFRATAVSTPSQDGFVTLIYICLIFWNFPRPHPPPPHWPKNGTTYSVIAYSN